MESIVKTYACIRFDKGTFLIYLDRGFLMEDHLKKLLLPMHNQIQFHGISGSVPGFGDNFYTKKTPSIQVVIKFLGIMKESGLDFDIDEKTKSMVRDAEKNEKKSRATETATRFKQNRSGHYPYPFQGAGIDFLMGHEGKLLADETGLGKTTQAIYKVIETPKIKTVLVICPVSVKLNWEKEIRKMCNLIKPDPRFQQETAIGWTPRHDLVCIPKNTKSKMNGVWNIINHDRLRNPNVREQIAQLEPDLIIVDECHAFMNIKASRTRHFLDLTAPDRVAMSATPMNVVPQMHPVLYWLRPDMFGDRITFNAEYEKNPAKLGEDLRKSGILLRRTKHGCGLEFPSRIYLTRFLEPTSRIIEVYQEIAGKNIFSNYEPPSESDAERMKEELEMARGDEEKTRQVRDKIEREFRKAMLSIKDSVSVPPTEIFNMMREIEEAKQPALMEEILSVLHEKPKVVVVCKLRSTIDYISSKLDKKKIGNVIVHGDITGIDRFNAEKKFTEDPGCRVFLGVERSCREGLNLQVAEDMIVAMTPWDYVGFDQITGRTHRIGSKGNCAYRFLVFDNTMDSMIAAIVMRKARIFESVMA